MKLIKDGFVSFIASDCHSVDEIPPRIDEALKKIDNEINEREKFWISKLNTYYQGYNATLGGDGQNRIDRIKLKELYDKGYNNKEIAIIMGFERSNISKTLKAMGLKSNFSPSEKTILISPEGKEIEF